MKLKNKYLLFIIILHLTCLVLSFYIFENDRVIFILSEGLIIISIYISISLYKALISPLIYLKQGINAIKDRDFSVKFISTGKKDVDELISVYNQMIDELRMERTRQEEQHFFLEKLIQTSPTGIIVLDYDDKVTTINPRASKILEQFPALFTAVNSIPIGTSGMLRADGQHTFKIQRSHFIDRGFKRVFIMLEEVTAEIFKAEKNVYSKVIRMMAHEVNNTIGPVNSIIGSGLQTQSLWVDPAQAMLKDAFQIAIERNLNLNAFMKNLADLVKLNSGNIKAVDLNAILQQVLSFMRFKAAEKAIVIEFEPAESEFIIQADALQLEQAFINIIKNAIEAIESDGKIKVMLDHNQSLLTISDNGKGISEGVDKEIFTPFFSTKKDGQGIGLLLIREILINHGFEFNLKTVQPGQTDFTIRFAKGRN